jgi:DNA repair exonuclease SbcCD ATPase subunit
VGVPAVPRTSALNDRHGGMFPPLERIAQEQAAQHEREQQTAQAHRERQRQDQERQARAQQAWATHRDELQLAVATARQQVSTAQAELARARASGDAQAAMMAAQAVPGAQELLRLAEADLDRHKRTQPGAWR